MKKKEGAERRGQFLVNKKFQLTFIIFSFVVVLIVELFNFILMQVEAMAGGDTSGGLLTIVRFFGYVLIFLIVGGIGLVISNKMAGPLFKLRRHMDQVAAGEIETDITFRDDDFFTEVRDAYNKVLDRLRKAEKKSAG